MGDFGTFVGIRRGPKWRPKSTEFKKNVKNWITGQPQNEFLEPTGAPEAARSAPDLIFIDFSSFLAPFLMDSGKDLGYPPPRFRATACLSCGLVAPRGFALLRLRLALRLAVRLAIAARLAVRLAVGVAAGLAAGVAAGLATRSTY